jgi:hypothetical protein
MLPLPLLLGWLSSRNAISAALAQVDGSIRKKDDRRKILRQAKAARQAAVKEEAAGDLKRLKNIKKEELNSK